MSVPAVVQTDPIISALVEQGVTKSAIQELERFLELDKPITSDEEREAVHRAQMACRDIRTTIVSVCTKGRERAIEEQKAWIREQKHYTGLVSPIEDKLKARKTEWDSAAQRKLQEDVRKWSERVQGRKNRLWESGFQYDPMEKKWFFDEFCYTDDSLGDLGFNDMLMDEICRKVADRIKVAKELEAEREAELERKAREAEELRAKVAELSAKGREEMLAQAKESGEKQAAASAEDTRMHRDDCKYLRDTYIGYIRSIDAPALGSVEGKRLSERIVKGFEYMETLIENFIKNEP